VLTYGSVVEVDTLGAVFLGGEDPQLALGVVERLLVGAVAYATVASTGLASSGRFSVLSTS
jgi:hypothetical protein